jgi:hypothetical protein
MTLRPGVRRHQALGWAALAVGGLMLALVATVGPPNGPVVGSPAVRLVITLPDSLQMAIFGLFTLVALLVLALLFRRGLRRRKKDEDDFEFVHEEPKPSRWPAIFSGSGGHRLSRASWRDHSPRSRDLARPLHSRRRSGPWPGAPSLPEPSWPWC